MRREELNFKCWTNRNLVLILSGFLSMIKEQRRPYTCCFYHWMSPSTNELENGHGNGEQNLGKISTDYPIVSQIIVEWFVSSKVSKFCSCFCSLKKSMRFSSKNQEYFLFKVLVKEVFFIHRCVLPSCLFLKACQGPSYGYSKFSKWYSVLSL